MKRVRKTGGKRVVQKTNIFTRWIFPQPSELSSNIFDDDLMRRKSTSFDSWASLSMQSKRISDNLTDHYGV